MLQSARIPLGTPGAYALPEVIEPSLNPQRMDVCAFVGVAPRGPAHVPVVDQTWPLRWDMVDGGSGRPLRRSVAVPVRSFDDYVHVFGGFEGPGALPQAVASFFEQGGRQAWVVRIVHKRGAAFGDGCATGTLQAAFSLPLGFTARNEGSWGRGLRLSSGFTATALNVDASMAPDLKLVLPLNTPVQPGALLRLTDAAGKATLSHVDGLEAERDGLNPAMRWRATLAVLPDALPVRVELVEAWLEIREEGGDAAGRTERFERLALSPEHPRAMSTVLCERATLVWPHKDWAGLRLMPADARVELLRGIGGPFSGGDDAYEDIEPADFFDTAWSPADEVPGDGITALAPVDAAAVVGTAGITQLVVPDLYVPAQWADPPPVPPQVLGSAGAEFAPCVDTVTTPAVQAVPPSALTGLILDPRLPGELDAIIRLQRDVVAYCEATQAQIALLDVPPGLSRGRIEQWRARFDSSWAAAYHPWLVPARRQDQPLYGQESATVRVRPLPPSAVAAGIIARRELDKGIQYGPANELASQVIHVAESQPEGRADALHPLGINCFVRGPMGIELVAARTLSSARDWRQLSVRRLILMLRRTLLVEMQWAVFEPNGPRLWSDLHHAIESLLRGLFQAGAFAGRTEAESFFVRVLTEPWRLDRGELLVEIGVAPAEPLEFILVRLRREGDGTLNLES